MTSDDFYLVDFFGGVESWVIADKTRVEFRGPGEAWGSSHEPFESLFSELSWLQSGEGDCAVLETQERGSQLK